MIGHALRRVVVALGHHGVGRLVRPLLGFGPAARVDRRRFDERRALGRVLQLDRFRCRVTGGVISLGLSHGSLLPATPWSLFDGSRLGKKNARRPDT